MRALTAETDQISKIISEIIFDLKEFKNKKKLEITQSEKHKMKRIKKGEEESLCKIWNTIVWSNIYSMGVPEREDEKDIKNTLMK